MKYISLFSGIGGLEHPSCDPFICCEIDKSCHPVLSSRMEKVKIVSDVGKFNPPKADAVVGGWPCQDISVAGKQVGLSGQNSGLFYQLLRVARQAKAETIVAENVPNLLSMDNGAVFQHVLSGFEDAGYKFISWRTINARELGLPHQRRRVFIIASKNKKVALRLHRPLVSKARKRNIKDELKCDGFYWTAGLQSICYSQGFLPTLKVGSSLSIPSPPAIYFSNCVRKLSPQESLKAQGFKVSNFKKVLPKDIYRMTGNAVAVPVGNFVMDSLTVKDDIEVVPTSLFIVGKYPASGFSVDGFAQENRHHQAKLSSNLSSIVNFKDQENMSARAAAGLVKRLCKSKLYCPNDLMQLLAVVGGNLIQPDDVACVKMWKDNTKNKSIDDDSTQSNSIDCGELDSKSCGT